MVSDILFVWLPCCWLLTRRGKSTVNVMCSAGAIEVESFASGNCYDTCTNKPALHCAIVSHTVTHCRQ
jgi:hypothetical protein